MTRNPSHQVALGPTGLSLLRSASWLARSPTREPEATLSSAAKNRCEFPSAGALQGDESLADELIALLRLPPRVKVPSLPLGPVICSLVCPPPSCSASWLDEWKEVWKAMLGRWLHAGRRGRISGWQPIPRFPAATGGRTPRDSTDTVGCAGMVPRNKLAPVSCVDKPWYTTRETPINTLVFALVRSIDCVYLLDFIRSTPPPQIKLLVREG